MQINRKYNQIFKAKFPESIEALKYQLLWGDGYVGQFWFQWDLIIITFAFFFAIKIFLLSGENSTKANPFST